MLFKETDVRIPTYLKSHAKNAKEDDIVTTFDLVAGNGHDKFVIEYYGERFGETLIVPTDVAPQLIVATEPISGEHIVLFDGTRHGYNAMFCDEYDDKTRQDRPLDRYGDETYGVKFEIFYNIDYLEEKDSFVNNDGLVNLMSGEMIDFESLQCNGFDALGIVLMDSQGVEIEIICEELA